MIEKNLANENVCSKQKERLVKGMVKLSVSVFVFASLLGVNVSLAQAQNLLPNSSFEIADGRRKGMPVDWQCSSFGGPARPGNEVTKENYCWDNTVAHTGKYSVKMMKTPRKCVWRLRHSTRKIRLEPGKCYKLSAWVKTKSVTGKTCIAVSQFIWDKNKSKMRWRNIIESQIIKGTHDWTQLSLSIKTPLEKKVEVDIFLSSSLNKGEVWFDDVSLYLEETIVEHLSFADDKIALVTPIVRPPTIDGDLSDWKDRFPFPILFKEARNISQKYRHNWRGPDDLSVEFRAGYDKKNLYLAFAVRDDIFYQENGHWTEDMLQICFDPLLDRSRSMDMHIYRINFHLQDGAVIKKALNLAHEHTQHIRDIDVGIRREKPFTNYEISIPWKDLSPFVLKDRAAIGFTFQVNDADGPKSKKYKFFEYGPGGGTVRPNLYGELVFCKEDSLITRIEHPAETIQMDEQVDSVFKLIALSDRKVKIKASANQKDIYASEVLLKPGINLFWIKGQSLKENLKIGDNEISVQVATGDTKLTEAKKKVLCYTKEQTIVEIKEMQRDFLLEKSDIESLIKVAKSKGIDVTPYEATLTVARFSSFWAQKDMERKKGEWGKMKNTTLIAWREISQALAIVEMAKEELQDILANPESVRDVTYQLPYLSSLKVKDGRFINDRDEEIFFFGIHFGWDWYGGYKTPMPEYCGGLGIEDYKDACQILKKLGLNFQPVHHAYTPINSDPTLFSSGTDAVEQKANLCLENNCRMSLIVKFQSWDLGKRCRKEFPNLSPVKGNHCFSYDPDDPVFREAAKWYIRKYLKPHRAIQLYQIAGEPYFSSYTKFTEKKFQKWLISQYKSLKDLNKLWGTEYKDFSEISALPIGESKARKYDWYRFNDNRIVEWYQFVKNEIKTVCPEALITVMLSKPVCASYHVRTQEEKGIDVERIADEIQDDVLSFDGFIGFKPSPGYSIFWQQQSLVIDFLKSLHPQKVIVDDEWHPKGTASPGHVKAGLWLEFLHGVRANSPWIWKRFRHCVNPYQCRRLPNLMISNPILFNEWTRTIWELHRLSDVVSRFSQEKREVKILYSDSSRYQDPHWHFSAMGKVYEGLYFLGNQVGFITERRILKGALKDCKMLIIPNVYYGPDNILGEIRRYINRGGLVIVVGEKPFQYNERGIKRRKEALLDAKQIIYIPSTLKPIEYAKIFDKKIRKLKLDAPLRVYNKDGSIAFGVETRVVKKDGKYFFYLINLSDENKEVTIYSEKRVKKIKELIKNTPVLYSIFHLKPLDIKLLEIGIEE